MRHGHTKTGKYKTNQRRIPAELVDYIDELIGAYRKGDAAKMLQILMQLQYDIFKGKVA